MDLRTTVLLGFVLGACLPARAETPGEIARPDTYEGSMRLQREYDAQQQRSRDQSQQPGQFNPGQQGAGVAQGQDVLRTWQKRPPLAPDQNPLIGRWESISFGGPAKTSGGDSMAALAQSLLGGITAGMCDNMLGHGVVEFRPDAAVTVAPDGRERVMYHAEYRGGGSRVVVLPKDAGTFTHMIIDFDRPGHGVVAAVGCVLTRAGTGGGMAASGAGGGTSRGTGGGTASDTGGGTRAATADNGSPQRLATLQLTAGIVERPGQVTPAAGKDFWLLRGSAETALMRAGFTASPAGSVMHNFMIACRQHTPACGKGIDALQASTVSLIKTDARGHAQASNLQAGHYYVFSPLIANQRPMVWHLPIDIHAGNNALALDIANAFPVD